MSSPRKAGFRVRAFLIAFLLFVLGFVGQLVLRASLSSRSMLGPDAILGASFGAEAAAFLLTGLCAGFLARGFAGFEILTAAAGLAPFAYAVLWRLKPQSLSYDHFFATPGELVIWASLTAAAAWLLGVWGSSVAMLFGASSGADARLRYEAGIARRHLRLSRRTALLLLSIGLVVPGVVFAAGVGAQLFWKTGPRISPLGIVVAFGAVAGALLLLSLWARGFLLARRLEPGRRRKLPATVVMTAISIAGVAVGVTALAVVLSVMSGFEDDLKGKILGTNAHALLLKDGNEFTEWRELLPKVSAVPGVVGVSPFIMNEVILSRGKKPGGAALKAIDPATIGTVSDLPKQVVEGDLAWLAQPGRIRTSEPKDAGSSVEGLEDQLRLREQRAEEARRGVDPEALKNLPGMCIGKEMARVMNAGVGDPITMISPFGEVGPTGPLPTSKVFRVACVFESGYYEFDAKFAYIAIPEAQKFFKLGDNIVGLELKFRDVDASRANARQVVAALGGFPYHFRDWADQNRNLFSALKLEKLAMAIILTFIVLVASFNILSTLIMVVLEKTKEIAILKSMGATNASVMKIFVIEGLTIGVIGTGMGLLLGLALCSFIERFGLRLDPDVYYIANLPVNVDPLQFSFIAAASVALSYLATLYPATKASRLSPVDGLRED